MNISIIYEDGDILIVDKPAGVTVNKSDTTLNEETVQEWAEEKIKDQISKIKDNEESDFYKRAGIVHRLDKETSGVLIIAKNPEAFVKLQGQFKERVVNKTYNALVHGKLVPETGEISVPVGRLPWDRTKFGIIPGGRESATAYKVIDYYRDKDELYSFLEVSPRTGRTHQIRVHLKYIGYPIFADFLYAGRKTAKKDRKILDRVYLHAAKISFIHPRTGERVAFESPLPEELSKVLNHLTIIPS